MNYRRKKFELFFRKLLFLVLKCFFYIVLCYIFNFDKTEQNFMFTIAEIIIKAAEIFNKNHSQKLTFWNNDTDKLELNFNKERVKFVKIY